MRVPDDLKNLNEGPLSPRMVRVLRVVVVVLFGLWLACVLYLRGQVRQAEERMERNRIEQSRREEFLRRDAQYRQNIQQREQAPRVRNIFDGR